MKGASRRIPKVPGRKSIIYELLKRAGKEGLATVVVNGVSVVLLAIVWASSFWTLPLTVPIALIIATVVNAYSAILYGVYLK